MTGNESLYQRLGGQEAVDAAVDIFYRNVLRDDRISHFFDDVDMDEQIAKQKAFLTMVFGGPTQYEGRDLEEAHRELRERGLDDKHFDAVIQALEDALYELDVEGDLIEEVAEIAESTREDVLGR